MLAIKSINDDSKGKWTFTAATAAALSVSLSSTSQQSITFEMFRSRESVHFVSFSMTLKCIKLCILLSERKRNKKKGYACTKFCYSLNINGSLFFSLFLHLSVLFRCSLEHINITTQRYGLEIIRFENVDFWRRRALHESNDLKIAQRESALILCSFRLWPDLLVLCMCLC